MSIFARPLEVETSRRFAVAAAALFALGFLPLGFGSIATAAFFVFSAVAIEIVARRVPLRFPSPVGFAMVVCLVYFTLDVLSPLLYENQSGSWAPALLSLHFLMLPVIFAGMAPAEFDPVKAYVRGVRMGAIVGGVIAVIQVWDGIDRAMGGMINPLPFGTTAALFACISLIGAWDPGWRNRTVAGAAFAGGLIASFLSEARGAWLALPLLLIVAVFYFRARYGSRAAVLAVSGLAGIAAIVVITAGSTIRERIDETLTMFQAFDFGEGNREAVSLDQRAMLMAYGLEAVSDQPIFGYGPQNAVAEVRERAAADGYTIFNYRHLHNEYLTEAVGNGVVGLATLLLLLAAPIVTAIRSARDDRFHDRMALAAFLGVGTAIYGLTNIVLGHDITNTVYASALLTVCLGAAASGPRSRSYNRFGS